MTWWYNQENIDMLVHTAKDLDNRYPDQNIVGLGHSPSWLIHTVAQIRIDQGRKNNTAIIPFTGSWLLGRDANQDKETNATTASFKESAYVEKPTSENISAYFNNLSDRAKNILMPVAPQSKTVLVDLIVSANSYMSFIDALAKNSVNDNIDDRYQAHIYKPFFNGGNVTLQLTDNNNNTTASFNGYAQGREEAYFLNILSGSKGTHRAQNAVYEEKRCGRFMPLHDIRIMDKPESLPLDNRSDLKYLHRKIVETVRTMDKPDTAARIEKSRESFAAKSPRTADLWYYRGPGMHG